MIMAPVPTGIFSTVNGLIADATATVKAGITLFALVAVIGLWWKKGMTTGSLITAGLIAALAIWLVPMDGIATVANWLAQDLG